MESERSDQRWSQRCERGWHGRVIRTGPGEEVVARIEAGWSGDRPDRAFPGDRRLRVRADHLVETHLAFAALERLRGVDYDVAVMTGDFRAKTHGPFEATVNALRLVRPHLKNPVYAVLGNHDSLRMVPDFETMGIRVLLNESVEIERGGEAIYLAGIDDPHYFRTDNMEKAAEGIPSDAVSVLLAHSPEIYRQAAHAGFSVMLCGHTHGGQIWPFGYLVRVAVPFVAGRFQRGSAQLYVSRGTGFWGPPMRLFAPAEITEHVLCS
ncbi:MAG: metallophosphoesterase [Myxococcales bacterium]|nr:metallophosphoesterase [Myxococcales bacterium]